MASRTIAKRSGVVLAAASAIAVVAFATPGASAAPHRNLPDNVVVEPWTVPDPADAVPDDLAAAASSAAGLVDSNPSEYSGSWYDSDAAAIILGTTGSAGVQRAVRRGLVAEDPESGTSSSVTTEPATYSLAEGQQILDDFFTNSDLLDRTVMWRLAPDGDSFQVSMIGEPSEADLAELGTLPGAVEVEAGWTGKFEVTSGLDDVSPFAGGSRYFTAHWYSPTNTFDYGGRCTSGYPFVSGGTQYLLTAGHCFKKGTSHDQAWRGNGTDAAPGLEAEMAEFNGKTTLGSGTTGTIPTGNDNANHGDLALISATAVGKSVGDSIWTSNTDKRFVTSREAPSLNGSVCRSGTTTWEECGFTVASVNTTVTTTDSGVFKQVDLAYKSGEANCVRGGDSGLTRAT